MSIREIKSRLAEDFFTIDQAVDYVLDRHREGEFSRRQISRAIMDGNLKAERVGRLLYISREQMEKYSDNLMFSIRQPGKLRLRPGSLKPGGVVVRKRRKKAKAKAEEAVPAEGQEAAAEADAKPEVVAVAASEVLETPGSTDRE